jgi:DNA-binding MarR family transcriptional regulator
MKAARRTPEGEAATELILSTFRANGSLLSAGELLAEHEGLTSARWQVLGALALAGRPLTVPQIARRMGLTRQSVHSTVNRLVEVGLVELKPNQDHRRSQLVGLTKPGRAAYDAIDRRQARWANELAGGIALSDIETATRVLDEIARRIEPIEEGDPAPGRATAGRRNGG